MAEKALIVLSGGQDSTICLYWATKKFGKKNVSAVTYDYGQRHKIELKAAKKVSAIAGIKQVLLEINTFNMLGGNSLTGDIKVTNRQNKHGLPSTFVPGRNLIFLTFAASFAYMNNITNLVTGVCEADYAGYPDCRSNTMHSLEKTISLGMDYPVKILTPLMNKTKAESIVMAKNLGAMEALKYSHTCYNGESPPCGKCNACVLRKRGFAEAGIEDPLLNIATQNYI